jgi:ribosomal protein S11
MGNFKKFKYIKKEEKPSPAQVLEDLKKLPKYLEAKKKIQKKLRKLDKQERILDRPGNFFLEFLKSRPHDFPLKPSYYENQPLFKYLPGVFLSFLKVYFESTHSEFYKLNKQDDFSSKVMLNALHAKKEDESNYVRKLYNTKRLGLKYKHAFKRLYKKLRTNFGYKRFYNLIALDTVQDNVRVPVKEIKSLEARYALKKTVAKIPVTIRKLKPFLSATLLLQNLIIKKAKEAYTEKIDAVTKSSIFKDLNQWLRVAKKIPGLFSKSTRNPTFSYRRRISWRNRVPVKDYLKYVFFRGFFKTFVRSIRRVYRPSPGRAAFLDRKKLRLLRKVLQYKHDLRLESLLDDNDNKETYTAKLKELTKVGFWGDALQDLNQSSFKRYINQHKADSIKGFVSSQTSRTLDTLKTEPKTKLLGVFLSQLFNNPRALFRVLTKTSLNAIASLSTDQLKKFKAEKRRAQFKTRGLGQSSRNLPLFYETGLFKKYVYPQFLSGRRRLLSYDEIGIFQSFLTDRLFKKRKGARDYFYYFKSLKSVIKRKLRSFKRIIKSKRDYKARKRYFRRFRRKLPAFRIILRQSANNFFVTATVNYGSKVVNNFTSGLVGLTGPSRSTGYAASQVGRAVGSTLTKMHFGPSLCVFRSPITSKLRNLAKGIIFNFRLIKGFYDLIPRSHNGLRLPKPRRL